MWNTIIPDCDTSGGSLSLPRNYTLNCKISSLLFSSIQSLLYFCVFIRILFEYVSNIISFLRVHIGMNFYTKFLLKNLNFDSCYWVWMTEGLLGMTTEGSGSSFDFLNLKMKMPVTLCNPNLQRRMQKHIWKTRHFN